MHIFKTRYVIIEPGPVQTNDLVKTWTDVELLAEPRTIDHGPDAPEFCPTYNATKAIIDPAFPGRNTEHVNVFCAKGRADMFVDDMGLLDGLEVNEAATLIYWTASIVRLHYPSGIPAYADMADVVKDAHDAGRLALKINSTEPRIHGRAVLFDGRVWF